jgi:alpha-L-rhamnosidase
LNAEGRIPTPRGELVISWRKGKSFFLKINIPTGMTARVELPALQGASQIRRGGKLIKAHREGAWWILDRDESGSVEIEER